MAAQTQPAGSALFRRWAGLFLLSLVGWLPASPDLPRKSDLCVTVANGHLQYIRTQSTFDGQNRVTETEVLTSSTNTGGWVDVPNTHTRVTYNKQGRVATSTDAYNRVTTSVYDFAGRLIETIAPDGTVSRTFYDQAGRAQFVQDRCRTNAQGMSTGPATRTTNDPSGRVIRTDRCASITLQKVNAQSDTNWVHLPADFDSQVTMVLVSTAEEIDTSILSTTRSFYDAVGRLRYAVDARGNVTESVYDAAGRRTASVLYTGYSFSPTNALNPSGLTETTSFTYDANGNQTSVTDAAGHTTTSIYDAGNRVTNVWFPSASGTTAAHRTTTYDALGRKIGEFNENGVANTYAYDFRGLLTTVTLAAGSQQSATYSYQYDEAGNQISQTDPLNHTTTFQYDALGRRTARTLPGNSTETVEYSALADPLNSSIEVLKKTLTDFNGRTTIQIHDRMDRLVTNQLPAVPGFVGTTNTYQYTVSGQRAQVVQTGAVNRVTRYAYDGLGRLRAVSKLEGTLSYGYDFLGTVTNIGARYGYQWPASMPADGYAYESLTNSRTTPNPNGAEWNYTYDGRGRLQQVNSDGTTLEAAYAYDPVGNLTTVTQRSAVVTTYSYNERNWLRLVDSRRGANPVAQYDYDGATSTWTSRRLSPVGQRQRVVEWVNNTTRTVEYDYDSLRRLTNETIRPTINEAPAAVVVYAGTGAGFGYDAVGNRRSRQVTTGSLPGVTSYTGHAFDARDRLQTNTLYDLNGNTTNYTVAGQATNYVYDAENRLIKQSSAAGDVTLLYDADGNRVSKTVGTVTTFYLVETLNPSRYAQVMEERSALTGDPTITYVYGLGLISQKRAGVIHFYGTDGLGSVRYLTDIDGAVTDAYTSDAFGIAIGTTGNTVNLYRYTGQQWDPDLGMYYLRARYYRPELGRFWTMDSYEGSQRDPLSLHKYLYCHGEPLDNIDPSGHGDMSSFMITMSTWGAMATMLVYRAAPLLNRATVIAFEATSGNTVMLGGGGAVVALKQGTKMGGVGWATWQWIGNLLKGQRAQVGTYKELTKVLEKTGQQANHLNQAAAFPKIPYDEGVAAAIQGTTAVKTTAHHLYHESLEAFWKAFRKNGSRFGDLPTNAEYDAAMRKALETAGETPENIETLAKLAGEARKFFGYFDGPGGFLPDIPNPIPGF